MDDKLREQFLAATIRLKKMESMLVSDCEMQINELVILMSITKGCACGKSCGTNLNVPEIQKKLHIQACRILHTEHPGKKELHHPGNRSGRSKENRD